MQQPVQVELVADSVASAVAAQRGGAARVELCSALTEGGVTPSAGLIKATRMAVSLPVHVMIRPRGGDFCYTDDEFTVMQGDLELAKRLGADGVVLGILNVNGNVDVPRMRQLVDLARPLAVTFHRAFDMTADLFRALDDVCATGASRLLTSGGAQTAFAGREIIAQLVQRAKARIVVMPGSGIKPENARSLVESTGAREIHAGLRTLVESPMLYRNPQISMGPVAGSDYQRSVVLKESVRRLCNAVAGLGVS